MTVAGVNLWHLRKSIDQRNWPKHCVANRLGDHGHLRLRRLGSAERSTWLALPSCSQKPDGSWDEDEITGTGFPRTFYLKYDMYRQNFPLLALATYLNYRSGVGYHPGFYRCGR
jgi:Squalene cyclase